MANSLSISGQLAYAKSTGLMPAFDNAAMQTGIDRNLLLAVASRESHIGLALDLNWLGDSGFGIGLMQVDRRYHPTYARTYSPRNNTANVLKGAQVLQDEINRYNGNLKYALAAYNAGSGNVNKALGRGLDPDLYTTGDDYGRDVLDRYRTIQSLGETKPNYQGGKITTIKENPEDEAQRLILLSGAGLLSSILATSYLATKKFKN